MNIRKSFKGYLLAIVTGAAIVAITLVVQGCSWFDGDSPTEPGGIAAGFSFSKQPSNCRAGSCDTGVDFVNQSSGGDAFEWTFGDGTGLFRERSPSHLYRWQCRDDGEPITSSNPNDCDGVIYEVVLTACHNTDDLFGDRSECDRAQAQVPVP